MCRGRTRHFTEINSDQDEPFPREAFQEMCPHFRDMLGKFVDSSHAYAIFHPVKTSLAAVSQDNRTIIMVTDCLEPWEFLYLDITVLGGSAARAEYFRDLESFRHGVGSGMLFLSRYLLN